MSTRHHHIPVVEVSTAAVTAFDPALNQLISAPDVPSLAANLSSREVILALPRRSVFVRAVRMPDAPKAELAKVLSVQIGQFFPVPAADLAYDFKVTGDKSAEGRLVILTAVRSEALRAALDQLKSAGLRARCVVASALGSAVLAEEAGMPTCAVLDRTAEGLAIDVVVNGEVRISRVTPAPKTGDDLAGEIARTFQIAEVEAAPVLCAGGFAYEAKDAEIAASTLEAFTFPAADRIGIDIELPEMKQQRDQRALTQKMRLTVLVAAAAITVWTLVYLDRTKAAINTNRIERTYLTRVNEAKKREKESMTKFTSQREMNDTLKLAFYPAQKFSDLLTIATGTAPQDAWLTGITVERGRPISLRGTAKTNEAVSIYVDRLAAMDRFREVKLVGASNASIEDTPVVQFAVTARAIGNIPVEGAKK
jgi:Tfp pilus assembly protein PilN